MLRSPETARKPRIVRLVVRGGVDKHALLRAAQGNPAQFSRPAAVWLRLPFARHRCLLVVDAARLPAAV